VSPAILVLAAVQSMNPAPVPFGVGERFEYGAKWNLFGVGRAAIEVASIDTVRDQPAFHFRYTMEASAPLSLYNLTSTLESWTSMEGFHSLRFRQNNDENGRRFSRQFEIYPDSASFRQVEPVPTPPDAAGSQPSVSEPLDDASVLYFLRTVPLALGETRQYHRYFRADRNPITIKVLKREVMELPDGTRANCLVLNPVVGERGLFGPRADARLWLTDDARRIPVQIRSTQSWGTITLRLQRMSLAG